MLLPRYDEEVAEAEKKFKADLGEGDEELDEEEEEELQAARMDAGLYTLQMVRASFRGWARSVHVTA